MQGCDFRHTQIKSLSLWGNWERFLNSLLFNLCLCALAWVCVCVSVPVCVLCHYSLQMWKGVKSKNSFPPWDLFTSLDQKLHGWLLINFRTIHTLRSVSMRNWFFYTFYLGFRLTKMWRWKLTLLRLVLSKKFCFLPALCLMVKDCTAYDDMAWYVAMSCQNDSISE